MRPLRTLQQSRAALLSICAHGALLALFLLVGRGEAPTAASTTIIEAELIALAPSRPLEPAAVPPLPDAASAVSEAPPPSAPEPTPQPPTPSPADHDSLPPTPAPTPRQAEDGAAAESAAEATFEPQAPEPSTPDPAAVATMEPAPLPADGLAMEAPASTGEQSGAASIEPHIGEAVRRRLASWTGRLAPAAPAPTLEWREDGQAFTAVLTKLPSDDPMAMEQLRVEVTTERDGERFAAELRMTRVAFSNFAQFIDRWDPNVQIHDDVIDGRFHSNTEIRVSREGGVRPVFNGKVTLAARDVASDGTGFLNRRTMFPGGLETSVRRIVLPARAAALDTSVVTAQRSHRLPRDASLTFNADGSYDWRHLDGSGSGRRALDDEPFYVIGADDASITVSGTLSGKVLVYSPQHIIVTNDLRYASDPRQSSTTDYLGLVAERTVEIDEPEVTGPGDLEIHASIYARQRFHVRSYRSRPSGTLHIYGSVTAGSVSATEPRFATKIEFDERLTTMRAPGFPLSDRYELDAWKGEWRVLPAE